MTISTASINVLITLREFNLPNIPRVFIYIYIKKVEVLKLYKFYDSWEENNTYEYISW